MSERTLRIGDTVFDRVSYDRQADVLYVSLGEPQPAHHSFGTPEGHTVRSDEHRRIIGITLVNAAALLERGDLRVTIPYVVDIERSELEQVLAS